MDTVPLSSNNGDETKHETAEVPNSASSPTSLVADIPQIGEKKEKIDLDEFEKRQKHIEEQNRLKKEMLGKALALR